MIKTPRLYLTRLTKKDLENIHRKNCYPEVAKFNTIGIPKNLEETKQFLQPLFEPQNPEKGVQLCWSIRLKKNKNFIGEIGMQTSTPKYNKAEIHYSLIPHYWKKGFALEAVKALLNYGFKTLKLHRIEAGVATENVNSIKLLEKTGMKREGMHRKILPVGGKWIDNYSYAILEDDFLKENF